MGKSYDQISAHILNVERSVVDGKAGQPKGVDVRRQLFEIAEENIDTAGLEVGCVEPRAIRRLRDRATFIDRFTGTIHEQNRIGWIHGRIPSRDRAILSNEQKNRFCS